MLGRIYSKRSSDRVSPTVELEEGAQLQRREISELECEDELADKWSWQKKWFVLVVIAIVQTSMNFNTTLYGAGKEGIKQQFGVTEMQAVSGAAIFLITYAFGCELWAPWSEELGRKIVLQLSLFFVNVFCLPVALAPNFASVLVGRALGGLASAGGSVTLGIVADMYDPEDHQYAIAFVSLSSVGGSIFGAIISGFVESNLENPPLDYPLGWRWSIWIQLFFGLFVQFLHLFVPETRKTVLMDRIARQRRKADPQRFGNLYGPSEMKTKRERFLNRDMILATWARPFKMLATEPIVICLSLLSGFADALIFMCVQSFGTVYAQWWGTVKDDAGVLHADPWKIGLTFVPIGLAYLVSWATFLPAIKKNIRDRKRVQEDLEADAKKRAHVNYEGRMWWLLWTAPWLVIGLVIFSATSGGPPTHWMGTMVGSFMIGIANYAIYMATIDYMVAAYGEYSASATGGNGFARDFLAGLLTWSAGPFYQGIGADRKDSFHLQIPTGILSVISLFLVGSIYVIYYRGPMMREKSPFAQSIEHVREVRAASRAASRAPSQLPSRRASRVDLPGTLNMAALNSGLRKGSEKSDLSA